MGWELKGTDSLSIKKNHPQVQVVFYKFKLFIKLK